MLFYFYLRCLHFGLFISSLLISLMCNAMYFYAAAMQTFPRLGSIKYFLSYLILSYPIFILNPPIERRSPAHLLPLHGTLFRKNYVLKSMGRENVSFDPV